MKQKQMKGKRVNLETRLAIKLQKTCGCGVVHKILPSNAVYVGQILWFNCSCGSTLVKRFFKMEIL